MGDILSAYVGVAPGALAWVSDPMEASTQRA